METWIIPLLTAIGGAIVALIGRELIEWSKRPRFEIDFEEREGQKPYIPDYNDEGIRSAGDTYRVKYLRLIVRNKGKKPAMNCEAKLELVIEGASDATHKVALHWSRRDPRLYSTSGDVELGVIDEPEKVFAPINLNINDEETVDILTLPYSFSTVADTDHSPRFPPHIETVSLRQLVLQPKNTYHCKVTVYSSNTTPESFKFKVNWDGTLEGFNKAFIKD